MTTLTTTKAKLLFVEVPDKVSDIRIYNVLNDILLSFRNSLGFYVHIQIPSASGSTYTFLFTTKQGREEDWKPLVDDFCDLYYYDYATPPMGGWAPGYTLDTATSSGLSLQQANGMDVNKNWAVIEVR